ncbi:DUF881 domain-containing protein [Janibacter cremeus]|uniref:Uncharacterized protein YlxW (UPF0749 family) n=1 Tax=Janibacter cremeus TaxID=1285192 RepID=A0A852VHX2_9MICO|nr:uncharacterized protein YlxW (UPF0749 family) [Janibacter cremeus]
MRPDEPTPDVDESEVDYVETKGTTTPRRRADASMTLLTSMLERPLDPGYAAAAERREAAGLPRSSGTRRPALIVWVLVIGLMIGVSTANLRGDDGTRADARAQLIEQIEDRQEEVDGHDERIRELRAQISTATALLDPDVAGDRHAGIAVASGLVPVAGPGLRVTLDDAPGTGTSADGDPRTGANDEGRVRSKDLQLITNGLWGAGAEAIAINGQRLTSRTAIRFAGEAILVNFRPLTRPYTIEAIGDPQQMQTDFAESTAGSYLTGLRNNYGILTTLTTQDDLDLPSATNIRTHAASAIPAGATPPAVIPRKKETP